MFWYHIGKITVKILFLFLTRRQVRGEENIPSQGPLLIVANHLSLVDPPLLGISVNRRVIFMAKEELFRSRFSRYFLCRFGAFPVYRGRMNKQALRQAAEILANGQALVVFPEGTRSKNARLQSAFPGSALISLRSGVPILPIGIIGTERIKGVAWLLHRPRVTVNIGPPFYLPSTEGKWTKGELAELSDSMMEHIAELLPSEYRGDYSGEGN